MKSQANKPSKQAYKFTASTYAEIKSRKVDVEELKTEQNYKPISPIELKMIATEANIEQSIEDLLIDLKQMG